MCPSRIAPQGRYLLSSKSVLSHQVSPAEKKEFANKDKAMVVMMMMVVVVVVMIMMMVVAGGGRWW